MRNVLANLAAIMIRPRAVMRRILDGGRDRMFIPIVLLATISAMIGDLDSGEMNGLRNHGAPFALIVIAIILGIVLLSLGFFYLVSWAAYGLGKVLEGTGSPRDVRVAIAWGLVPMVWAMLYRIPALFLVPRPEGGMELDQGVRIATAKFGSGCAAMAVFGILELTALAWLVVVSSNTLGEAHRFSSWRGLATLVLVGISPAIITLAAVLAM